MLSGPKHALEVDRHDPVPFLFVVIRGLALRTADARVVKCAIEPPICLHRGCDQRLDLGGARDVTAKELRLAAFAANHLDSFATALLHYVRDDYARTLARKDLRGSTPDSGPASSYDRTLAVKKFSHRDRLPCLTIFLYHFDTESAICGRDEESAYGA
jgi:hypothetical protein